MEDLSLHIMDIVENSLRAGAEHIAVRLVDKANHILVIEVEDDGRGMNEETLKNAANPFYTTKNGKRYGLGLSLLSQACEDAGGRLRIEKGRTKGIKVIASFKKDNVDIKPMGNIDKTMRVFRALHPEVHISFERINT
ncbi:MAG: ATP-binding protein [Candidatus Aminicenantes bacterium]|nr:ATP-binding protein [Candidatus Aminicenantes bacterium]NIM80678.1 ATP-binding protein [Candidatus Aminicenantes bacterium]NIN20055.1 ATP-binding protein [Candidatus Aminicenantes bacterium]NIN43842.1 ATP-binding protein [Candidatus Aminicenantes bacterium]NIN86653.1 ATP-binding protein [Candidatus Aminicenantes bacterium]